MLGLVAVTLLLAATLFFIPQRDCENQKPGPLLGGVITLFGCPKR